MSKLKESAKVYKHADDKNVATYLIYSDGTNVFYDSAKQHKVTLEDLKDFFLKGVVVKNDTGLFPPIAFKETDTEATITIHDGTSKTDLTSETKSEEEALEMLMSEEDGEY